GQVKIEKDACELQIDALAACCGADHYTRPILQLEAAFSSGFGAVITATENYYALTGVCRLDFMSQEVHCPQICGKDHNLFVGIFTPQGTKAVEQLLHLGFTLHRKNREQVCNSQPLFR